MLPKVQRAARRRGARPAPHPGRDATPACRAGPHRHRGPDRDRAGPINVEEICAASPRLESIVFGPADFAASIGMPVTTDRRDDSPTCPSQPLQLRLRQDLDGRAGQRAPRDRRAVPQGPRPRRAAHSPSVSALLRLRRQVGADPRSGASCSTRSTPRARSSSTSPVDILDAYRVATEKDHTGAVMFGDEMIDEASAQDRELRSSLAASDRGCAAPT